MSTLLKISQFGVFGVFSASGDNIPLGAKHQALLALLSTAENGIRTRAFLEHTLWSLAQPEQAKASLRTALSTLRRQLGPDGSSLIRANRERVVLDLDAIEFIGGSEKGDLMDGFDLPHELAFRDWLVEARKSYVPKASHSAPGAAIRGQRNSALQSELLPRIAVLPFVHRTSARETSQLGAVLSEELVRQLSRGQAFAVTSYLTSRQFDPQVVSPPEVAAATGVTFLISGTVYVKGGDFCLKSELHDAAHERVLWSREFTGGLEELMEGQCQPLQELAQQIAYTVTGEAVAQAQFKPLADLENHTLLMAAISLLQETRPERFGAAQEILGILLRREPGHPVVMTWMGFWHVMRVQHGLSTDRQMDTHLASHLAESALGVDPEFSLALTLKGMISSHLNRRFDLAQGAYDLALKDNPNEALALLLKGAIQSFQGASEEGIRLTEAARRLSPLGPQRYFFDAVSATAQLSAGHYEAAVQLADQSLQAKAGYPGPLRTKAIALELCGRRDEARTVVRELLSVAPDFTVRRYLQEDPAALARSGETWGQALRNAGVPE